MFFLFYIIPLLVSILSGVFCLIGNTRNIAGGILFIAVGFVPLLNIAAAILGFIILSTRALNPAKGN